jgi:hypothetical protein
MIKKSGADLANHVEGAAQTCLLFEQKNQIIMMIDVGLFAFG